MSRSPTSPRCRALSRPPTPCPTRTGAMASRLAGWRRSTLTRVAWCPPAGWDSTSPAACAPCTPGCRLQISHRSSSGWPTACHPHSGRSGSTGQLRLNAARWTRCCAAARAGRSSRATAARPIWIASRSMAAWPAPSRARCPSRPSAASATRSAPSVRQPLPRVAGNRRDLRHQGGRALPPAPG